MKVLRILLFSLVVSRAENTYRECFAVLQNFTFGIYVTKENELRRDTYDFDPYYRCLNILRAGSLEGMGVRAFGQHHPVILVPSGNKVTLVPAMDFVVGAFVKVTGSYDNLEDSIISDLVHENDTVIEIGSNIGVYTTTLAKKARVRGPDFNGMSNLGAMRIWMQQKAEVASLSYGPYEDIDVWSLDEVYDSGMISAQNRDYNRSYVLPKIKFAFFRVSFLKIDVEGMEAFVAEGALNLIRRDRPVIYAENQMFFWDKDTTFVDIVHSIGGYNCAPHKELEDHQIVICHPDKDWRPDPSAASQETRRSDTIRLQLYKQAVADLIDAQNMLRDLRDADRALGVDPQVLRHDEPLW